MFWDAPGMVRRVEHHIPTTPGWVIRVPLHRTHLAMKKTLTNEVQSMLSLGVIEETTSPW